jgi:hypothetical protein
MLIQELIDDLLNETLLGTYRAHFNQLLNPISDTDSVLTVIHPFAGVGDGSYLEIEQELMYVVPKGINQTAKTAVVIRGVRGTTAVPHVANLGVSLNPRFARSVILASMQEEARSWPISMFQVQQIDISLPASVSSIDLATALDSDKIIRTVRVWRRADDPDVNRWIPLNGWRFEKDLFQAGSADLFLAKIYDQGREIRILVALPFDDPAGWTELSPLSDSGIPDSAADVLKYGAAWRLITGREARRLFTEIESEGRNSQEVPAGTNLALGRNLKLVRDGRLAEEISRLRSLYGVYGR